MGLLYYQLCQSLWLTTALLAADYECLTAVNINCEHRDSEPQEWNQGAASIAYYGNGNFENTLPRTSSPWEFVEDSTGKAYWANVPAGAANWRGTDRGSGQENVTYTQNISGINGYTRK